MRYLVVLVFVGIMASFPSNTSSADALAEICAEYPDLAGCDPNTPITLEEYCTLYPGWAGCRPGSDFCLDHSDWETCQGTAEAITTNDPDTEEFIDGLIDEMNEEEDTAVEEALNADGDESVDDILEGLGPDDIFIIDDPEAEDPSVSDAVKFVDDLLEEMDEEQPLPGEVDDEDGRTDEEFERDLDAAEEEQQRACETRTRLTAQRAQLEIEEDRTIQNLRREEDSVEMHRHGLEVDGNEIDSIGAEFRRVHLEIEELKQTHQPVPPNLAEQRSHLLQALGSANRAEEMTRSAMDQAALSVARYRAQLQTIDQTRERVGAELAALPPHSCN